jgi:hypothetical protein
MHSLRAESPQPQAGSLRYGTLLSLLLTFLLTACTTTEEIWLNADGTVRRELRYDLSAMMSFANMMEQAAEEEVDEEEEWPMIADLPYDSLDHEDDADEGYEGYEEYLEDDMGYAEEHEDDDAYSYEYEVDEEWVEDDENDMGLEEEEDGYWGWEEDDNPFDPQGVDRIFEDMAKQDKIDTLISFRSILLEMLNLDGSGEDDFWQSLAADESMSREEKMAAAMLINAMLNMHVRINSDKAAGVYQMSLIQDFDSFDGLNSVGDLLGTLLALSGEKNLGEAATLFDMMGQTPAYSLKKKEFRLFRPAEPEEEEEAMTEEDLYAKMMQAFMEHEYIIHFPGKVKKVNLKDAKIEGNTVRISAPAGGNAASKPFELIVKYK